jgi:lysophospholipase L1-like esterase
VTVTLGDAAAPSTTTVKAELRRLMLEKVVTAPGRFVTRSFIVNLRTPQLPGGGEVRLKEREKTTEGWAWDEKLTLEFNAARPALCALDIEPVNLPTVFLLGDSTVADQPREPYSSWGQMLPRFFTPQVAVANHAESGESLKSSLSAHRLDKVLSLLQPGDYLFIQYGHNDQKEKGEGVGAFTTYKADLQRFVAAARARGGLPVLVTPMHRLNFDARGKIVNTLGDYPEAVRQVAREEQVPLIDLNQMSQVFYEALGPARGKLAFKDGDATHHNNYGSYMLAQCIVSGMRANRLGLVKFLAPDAPRFDPRRPPPVERFALSPSPLTTVVKPLGN